MIAIVGAGGTGSHVAHKLGMYLGALQRLRPYTKQEVHIYDSAHYREANLYRQVCLSTDMMANKAIALASNISSAFGVDMIGFDRDFRYKDFAIYDYIFICVDSHKWRSNIRYPRTQNGYHVIDCGNDNTYGQVLSYRVLKNSIIGQTYKSMNYPAPEVENVKSCTIEEALEKQSLFINSIIADIALKHFHFMANGDEPRSTLVDLESLKMSTFTTMKT